MGIAACSGGNQRHNTTVVPHPEPNQVEDAGVLQPNMRGDYCVIETDYLEDHKSCAVDEDCVTLSYRPTCCASARLVGVNQESFEELSACADKAVPVCTSCEVTPDRAEDGRTVMDGVATQVRCDAGRCVTSITQRACGDKLQCKASEICVSYGDALSGAPPEPGSNTNAYVAYACVPNPCAHELDCDCAVSACDARGVGKRKCEIARNDESDVACVPYKD